MKIFDARRRNDGKWRLWKAMAKKAFRGMISRTSKVFISVVEMIIAEEDGYMAEAEAGEL